MKYTRINITNNTVVEAYGTHTNGNRKGVYIVELKMACMSLTDAAEVIGCSLDSVSNVIRGKQKTCKGYHIIELSKMGEAFPQLMEYSSCISTPRTKGSVEVSREEMAEFRKWKAEKEARRKAEEKARKDAEKRAKKISDAEAEVHKLEAKCKSAEAKCTHFQAQLDKNAAKLLEAQQKLLKLKRNEVVA